MPGETTAARKFLDTVLKARPALMAAPLSGRIFMRNSAPQGSVYPLMLGFYAGGTDRNAIGLGVRVLHVGLWTVKVVTEGGSYLQADSIEQEFDTALLGAHGGVSSPPGYIFGVERMTAVEYSTWDASVNKEYTHKGGVYRLWIGRA